MFHSGARPGGSCRFLRTLPLFVVCCLGVSLAAAPTEEQVQFFEAKVRPIFATKCVACHGEQLQMAGLKLTTAAGFFKGADTGPIFAEGDVEGSRLMRAVGYVDNVKMPPTGKLAGEEIDALKTWVEMGAPWPKMEAAPGPAEAPSKQSWSQEKINHWSF